MPCWHRPSTRDELKRHRLITSSWNPALNRWSSGSGGVDFVAQVHTRADNTAVAAALIVNGVGIGRLVDLIARPMVSAGLLVPVLPDVFATAPLAMYAVMLQERHRLPKVRACIDFWKEWLARP